MIQSTLNLFVYKQHQTSQRGWWWWCLSKCETQIVKLIISKVWLATFNNYFLFFFIFSCHLFLSRHSLLSFCLFPTLCHSDYSFLCCCCLIFLIHKQHYISSRNIFCPDLSNVKSLHHFTTIHSFPKMYKILSTACHWCRCLKIKRFDGDFFLFSFFFQIWIILLYFSTLTRNKIEETTRGRGKKEIK